MLHLSCFTEVPFRISVDCLKRFLSFGEDSLAVVVRFVVIDVLVVVGRGGVVVIVVVVVIGVDVVVVILVVVVLMVAGIFLLVVSKSDLVELTAAELACGVRSLLGLLIVDFSGALVVDVVVVDVILLCFLSLSCLTNFGGGRVRFLGLGVVVFVVVSVIASVVVVVLLLAEETDSVVDNGVVVSVILSFSIADAMGVVLVKAPKRFAHSMVSTSSSDTFAAVIMSGAFVESFCDFTLSFFFEGFLFPFVFRSLFSAFLKISETLISSVEFLSA